MATTDNSRQQQNASEPQQPSRNNVPNTPDDLTDSPADQERLKDEVSYIDLPDVSDIPGQENFKVPQIADAETDATASSDDEEGLVNEESDDDGYFAEGEKEKDNNANDDTVGIP